MDVKNASLARAMPDIYHRWSEAEGDSVHQQAKLCRREAAVRPPQSIAWLGEPDLASGALRLWPCCFRRLSKAPKRLAPIAEFVFYMDYKASFRLWEVREASTTNEL